MKNKIVLAVTAIALSAGVFAGQVQAHTEWRFPHKGTPYAVPHTHAGGANTAPLQAKRKAAKKSKQSLAVKDALIIIAHHKPG